MKKIFATLNQYNTLLRANNELERKLENVEEEQTKLKRAELSGLKDKIEYLEIELRKYKSISEKQIEREGDIRNDEREMSDKKLEEAKKIIEERIEGIVKERVITTVGAIKAENISLKKNTSDTEERLTFYKEKYENGKIELGANEIKGFLLAANPNGDRIMKRITEEN